MTILKHRWVAYSDINLPGRTAKSVPLSLESSSGKAPAVAWNRFPRRIIPTASKHDYQLQHHLDTTNRWKHSSDIVLGYSRIIGGETLTGARDAAKTAGQISDAAASRSGHGWCPTGEKRERMRAAWVLILCSPGQRSP